MDIVFCIPSPPLMIGALVGMSALRCQSHMPSQHRRRLLVVMLLFYGTVSFALSFVLSSRLAAGSRSPILDDITSPGDPPVISQEMLDQAGEVTDELWRRLMVPPPLRQSCYGGQSAICEFADDVAPGILGGDWGWGGYMQLVGRGFISAAATSALVFVGVYRKDYEPDSDDLQEMAAETHQGGTNE